MKFLRIEKSLTSAENVVLSIVSREPGATLLNTDQVVSIEVCADDMFVLPTFPSGAILVDEYSLPDEHDITEFDMPEPAKLLLGTVQGL